jgi:dipeptide/tripeptide permease
MMATPPAEGSNLGIVEQFKSLSGTFWLANVMEMFERLAYYGLRTVLPVYMLLAVESGGPQFDNIQKGMIFGWWAMVQSFVPVFSGGYADRFGYRRTVAVSVAFAVAGFLAMAHAQDAAALLTGGASVGQPGHEAVFRTFTFGALLLALGTAVFKPGLQGLMATQIDERNSSFAWGIFYQVVNIGGFLGPILAGVMRVMDWTYVFWACAGIASLNWLMLFVIQEPARPAPSEPVRPLELVMVAVRGAGGILEPRLFAFLVAFSGFWAMFYQLFDLLPVFIEDWVDTTGVYASIAVPLFGLVGSSPPEAWAGRVPQEMMVNLNAGMIMLAAFGMGYITGFFRSMTNMIVGILVSAGGILLLGTMDGWAVLGAIVVFSLGEMMASPTKMRYVAAIAPPEKKGLYLGYVNATVGIGWSIGSFVAGSLYEETGDKVSLARKHLVEVVGVDPDTAAALPKSEVLSTLASKLGVAEQEVVQLLWSTYDPGQVWDTFMAIGLTSMVGLVVLDQVFKRVSGPIEEPLLGLLAGAVAAGCYGWQWGAVFAVMMLGRWAIKLALPQLLPDRAAWLEERPWLPGTMIMAAVFVIWVVAG